MTKTTKITKAMVISAIMSLVDDENSVIELEGGIQVTGKDIMDYCDTVLTQIENKAAKAKERAAKNKETGDALRAEVLSHITDEFQTVDEIVSMITGFEDVTKGKIVSRLTQLVNSGEVIKEAQRIDKHRVMCYKLASAE